MPPLPRAFTPTPAGGAGWSGWSKPAPPSLRPPGPVPAGNPVTPPKTVPPAPWAKTPGRLPGNGAPPSQPYTSPPAPKGPGFGPPAQPKPKTPTSNPNTPKKPAPAVGPNPGAALGGDAKILLPPGFWIGGGAFLGAAAAAASKLFWPPPPGDGTEGTAQTQTQFVPGKPGQGGLVPGKQYRVKIFSVTGSTFDWRASSYNFSEGNGSYLAGQWGPVILNSPVSISTETTERDWRHWGLGFVPHDELVVIDGPGNRYSIYIQAGSGGYDTRRISSFSYQLERVDGTPELADQIESGHPPKPEIQQTNVTQNIQAGDTNININPPIIPGVNPVLPPLVAPPTPATPTPTGNPGAGAPTPTPSPQPQPAPPPTVNPGAPNTNAGTPANQAPTTGPRPSPGSAPSTGGGGSGSPSRGGGSSGAATAAGLIAGTSPGVAGLIGAINNSAKPKPQTPTGNPVVIPGSDTSTGPNSQPVSQTGTTVIPNTNTNTTTNTNTNTTTNTNTNTTTNTNTNTTTNITNVTNVTNTVTNTTNTVTNQINQANQQQQNSQQQALDQLTNPTGQGTTTTTTTTTTINQQLLDLQKKSDADLASTLAILGTLATMAALNQSTSTITTAIQNQPSPCSYPAYHPQNQAERAAISNKVDGVNTVLGTVTNVQIAEAKTGINSILGAIGSPIAGAGTTVFEGIHKIQVWGDKFSKALRLDRVYNFLAFILQIHNAAILSRNLGESLGFLIDASLQALNLKDENDEELNLTQIIGTSIENHIKSIVGNDIYNGLSRQWKLISAIYTAAINVYEMSLSAFGGLAEGVSVIGEYQGKIGNALKRSGGVMQNAYDWMEENFKIKMSRAGYLGRVADGLQEAEDVVSNVTEFPESINEVQETYKEASEEIKEARQLAEQLRQVKVDTETQNKTDSASPNIADNDAFKPPI